MIGTISKKEQEACMKNSISLTGTCDMNMWCMPMGMCCMDMRRREKA